MQDSMYGMQQSTGTGAVRFITGNILQCGVMLCDVMQCNVMMYAGLSRVLSSRFADALLFDRLVDSTVRVRVMYRLNMLLLLLLLLSGSHSYLAQAKDGHPYLSRSNDNTRRCCHSISYGAVPGRHVDKKNLS